MNTLFYLSCRETLKNIVADHPKLVYYICHKRHPNNFPVQPFIDEQEDCKKLDQHGITEYKSRKERTTHGVTGISCRFSSFGESVAEELCQKGICDEILELIKQIQEKQRSTHIDKQIFAQEFLKYFTFDEDPSKVIENKINEINRNYNITLPDDGDTIPFKGNSINIKYSLEGDFLCINFRIMCTCSKYRKTMVKKNIDIEFKKNHFEIGCPLYLNCKYCSSSFIMAPNLKYCRGKIIEFSP
ncbi:MAG: hypothetical protein ACFFDL_15755 [Promethearchaeota archaeon]